MIMDCAFVSALESCGGFGIKILNAWWLLLFLFLYGFVHNGQQQCTIFFPVGSRMRIRLQVHLVGGSQYARHLNRGKLEPEENKTFAPEIGVPKVSVQHVFLTAAVRNHTPLS
jgi:hypothetical protein